MSILTILTWPDPRLAQVCAPVADITSEIETLAQDMLETMYEAPGRGLAAPQVGLLLRMFVMDAGWKEGHPDPIVCVNPTIQRVGDERAVRSEACLSIPAVTAEVSRAARVRMAWTALDGDTHERELEGFAATCAQHELDHLDGVVTLDHLTAADRAAVLAVYEAQ